MHINLKIATPDGLIYDAPAEGVSLPTASGEITVLSNHIPLVTMLVAGEVRVHTEHETTFFSVSSGVVEVRPGSEVIVMAETAERAEHIDIERAEAAKLRAQELIKNYNRADEEQFAFVTASLEKELARVRVGKKWRNVGSTNN